MNLLAYSDGTKDLLSVAEKVGAPIWKLSEVADKLVKGGVLLEV